VCVQPQHNTRRGTQDPHPQKIQRAFKNSESDRPPSSTIPKASIHPHPPPPRRRPPPAASAAAALRIQRKEGSNPNNPFQIPPQGRDQTPPPSLFAPPPSTEKHLPPSSSLPCLPSPPSPPGEAKQGKARNPPPPPPWCRGSRRARGRKIPGPSSFAGAPRSPHGVIRREAGEAAARPGRRSPSPAT
jgi:hypothetical protein